MRNNTLTRIIIATLLCAFLTLNVGKVTRIFALADPQIIPELAPVFDTQIIAIEDYIENNVTPPQFEVFNILLGLYVAGQGGFSEYKLHDPYANSSDIIDWLKSCGIRLYNHLIGMGAIGPDPITGIDYRPYIKGAVDIAMGCAVKATQYDDVNDFVSDVNVQDKYFIPMDFGIQGALNYIFSKNGGMYEWQFETSDFETNLTYNTIVLPPTDSYWTLLASYPEPRVRCNYRVYNNWYNGILDIDYLKTYTNLFLNTTTSEYYFYSDSGEQMPIYFNLSGRWLYYQSGAYSGSIPNWFEFKSFGTYPSLDTYPDIVQYLIDNPQLYQSDLYIFINDFVKHYYYGPNWDNKTEIFHTTNLNLDPNTLPYYQQITNDYLLDVKGILADLLNETDLTNVILNNIYDFDAVKVEDPKLIRITTDILEEIQVINPPIPVNLNDFEIYTQNDYLNEIKERSTKFGETIGEYFVFWHNSDPVTLYVMLGSVVVVLLGAFVGKLGHS